MGTHPQWKWNSVRHHTQYTPMDLRHWVQTVGWNWDPHYQMMMVAIDS
jgi:hypothetical protein